MWWVCIFTNAGIATTVITMSFRSLWSNCSQTVQIFSVSILKLCASVNPVFLVYVLQNEISWWRKLFCIIFSVVQEIIKMLKTRAIWNNNCSVVEKNLSVLPRKFQSYMFKTVYLENRDWYCKKAFVSPLRRWWRLLCYPD